MSSLQIVEPVELFSKGNVAHPHTSHCLGTGDIMISCLGDPSGNGKGTKPLGPWKRTCGAVQELSCRVCLPL